MKDKRIYAWIFLSIKEQPTSLQEVIAAADGINHAIPMLDELQTSFGWLQAQGLIKKDDKKYLYTATGIELMKSISSKSIFAIWDKITEKFTKLPDIDYQLEELTEADILRAYKLYRKM